MMPGSDLEIQDLLPHRPPFLFVDRIVALESGCSVEGIFEVPEDHPFINRGMDRPVFPAFLLVEALGQVAALCIRRGPPRSPAGPRPSGYLVRVDQCYFDHEVHVGDQVHLLARLIAGYGPLFKFAARGEVSGHVVVQASLTLYLDIS
jgi:3-hydroxyacyl-[acyl-carrier-protein] dehydratase